MGRIRGVTSEDVPALMRDLLGVIEDPFNYKPTSGVKAYVDFAALYDIYCDMMTDAFRAGQRERFECMKDVISVLEETETIDGVEEQHG